MAKPDDGGQLIHCPALDNAGVAALPDMGRDNYHGPAHVCNWDIRTEEGRNRFMQAAGDTEAKASDFDGQVFRLKYWMCEAATFRDEITGDVVSGVRVNMWDDEGKRVTAASWALSRYLDRLVKCYGQGPYDPPIGLRVKNVVRRDGKRTYAVDIVDLPKDDGK